MPLESPRKAADALFSEEAREVADEGLNRCTGFLEACTYSWNNLKETLMNFAGWLEGNVSMAKEEFIVLGVMVLGIIGFFLLGYGLVSWIIKKVCGNG